MTPEPPVFRGGRRLLVASVLAAAVGAAGLAVGFVVAPRQALFSYLAAYCGVTSVALGALIWLMIGHAGNTTWPVAVRRLTEVAALPLSLLAVLFVPIAVGMGELYVWTRPESIASEHARHLVEHKAPYLNVPAFLVRAVVYFVLWIAPALVLFRASVAADSAPGRTDRRRMRALSAALLPFVALSLTFASFDWLMSLTPTWTSSMFGVYWFSGGFASIFALLAVLMWAGQRAGLLPGLGPSHYYAVGRLMLTAVVFWAYAGYFQYFLIWIANRPEEAEWWVVRSTGGWQHVTRALAVVHFVVPFFALLSYRLKRRPRELAIVGAWILASHVLDAFWLVAPIAHPDVPAPVWTDPFAWLAVAGAAVAFATWQLRARRTMPLGDPVLARALEYHST